MQPAACNKSSQFTQHPSSSMLHLGEGTFIKCRFQARIAAQTSQSSLTSLACIRVLCSSLLYRVSIYSSICSLCLRCPYQLYPLFGGQVTCKWGHQATMLNDQ